jgi:hypothetical protein
MKKSHTPYFEKLKDARWQKVRLKVMERDGFCCRECGKSDGSNLQVHHLHYIKGDPWDTPMCFLMTLCDGCHEKRQTVEDDLKCQLGLVFQRTSLIELIRVLETDEPFASFQREGRIIARASDDDFAQFYELRHAAGLRRQVEKGDKS